MSGLLKDLGIIEEMAGPTGATAAATADLVRSFLEAYAVGVAFRRAGVTKTLPALRQEYKQAQGLVRKRLGEALRVVADGELAVDVFLRWLREGGYRKGGTPPGHTESFETDAAADRAIADLLGPLLEATGLKSELLRASLAEGLVENAKAAREDRER